jgi:Na+-transporting methylmalonyl-CoA/oxaloacetate decarboxylase gamma subunit
MAVVLVVLVALLALMLVVGGLVRLVRTFIPRSRSPHQA